MTKGESETPKPDHVPADGETLTALGSDYYVNIDPNERVPKSARMLIGALAADLARKDAEISALKDANLSLASARDRESMRANELAEGRHELVSMIEKLSLDPDTGILTLGAMGVLADMLTEGKVLEVLRSRGYILKLCLLDVDELKMHNSLGGHDAGDSVLGEVARRLKRMYRREADIMVRGLMQIAREAHEVVEQYSTEFDAQSRFTRGDEILLVRFLAPPRYRERRGESAVVHEAVRIKKSLDDLKVSYRLIPTLTPEMVASLDPQGRFIITTDEHGVRNVKAPVSVTFACIRAPMPVNRVQMRTIFRIADEAVILQKSKRLGEPPSHTTGITIYLEESDIG